MEQDLFNYEQHATGPALDTWMQYTLEQHPRKFIDSLDAREDEHIFFEYSAGDPIEYCVDGSRKPISRRKLKEKIGKALKSLEDISPGHP